MHLLADRAGQSILDRELQRADVRGAVLVEVPGTARAIAGAVRSAPARFASVALADPSVQPTDNIAAAHAIGAGGIRLLGLSPVLLREMAAQRLTATLYLSWAEILELPEVLGQLPDLNFVIDHIGAGSDGLVWDRKGRPRLPPPDWTPTRGALRRLASHPGAHVKLSGYYAMSRQAFPYSDLGPRSHELLELFGPDRLIWGSDFPFILEDPGYVRTLELLDEHLPALSSPERAAIGGANARRLFGFDPASR